MNMSKRTERDVYVIDRLEDQAVGFVSELLTESIAQEIGRGLDVPEILAADTDRFSVPLNPAFLHSLYPRVDDLFL